MPSQQLEGSSVEGLTCTRWFQAATAAHLWWRPTQSSEQSASPLRCSSMRLLHAVAKVQCLDMLFLRWGSGCYLEQPEEAPAGSRLQQHSRCRPPQRLPVPGQAAAGAAGRQSYRGTHTMEVANHDKDCCYELTEAVPCAADMHLPPSLHA